MIVSEMSTTEIKAELFSIGKAIAQERSIGQVTPSWRRERDQLKKELQDRK